MDANRKPSKYLELKEFLSQNPCVKPRTFTRWKQRGLIDFLQPGGPNTAIFVPADALERMEQRSKDHGQVDSSDCTTANVQSDLKRRTRKPRAVRQPDWKKRIKPQTKEKYAKEE